MHKTFAKGKTKEAVRAYDRDARVKALFIMFSEDQIAQVTQTSITPLIENARLDLNTHFQNILINTTRGFQPLDKNTMSVHTTTLDTKVFLMLIKLMSVNFQ